MTLFLALLLTSPAQSSEPDAASAPASAPAADVSAPAADVSAPAVDERQGSWTLLMPLGVPQLAQHRRRPALAFGAVQLAGVGVGTWSSIAMRQAIADEDFQREINLRMVSAVGIGVAGAGWMASVTDGARYYQLQGEEMAARGREWRAVTALAEGD